MTSLRAIVRGAAAPLGTLGICFVAAIKSIAALAGAAGASIWLLTACDSGQLVTLGVAPSNLDAEPSPEISPEPSPEPSDVHGTGGNAGGSSPTDPTSSSSGGADGGAAGPDTGGSPAIGGSGGATPAPSPTVLSEEPLFSEPVLVAELSSEFEDENPTLTSDLLEIYFTSRREGGPGNADVWVAKRSTPDEPFGDPEPVIPVSTPEFDSSPAVSRDGLTLWVAIEVDTGLGGLDIWASTRNDRDEEWSPPTNLAEVNSEEDDLPRPLGDGERVMPVQSRRGGGMYQMYLAHRESPASAFREPTLMTSLLMEGQAMGDGFITHDGLGVYFAYSTGGVGELYFASRLNREDDFNGAVPLSTLNTDSDERDPFLTADGQRFYFASDRDGELGIYEAGLLDGDGT